MANIYFRDNTDKNQTQIIYNSEFLKEFYRQKLSQQSKDMDIESMKSIPDDFIDICIQFFLVCKEIETNIENKDKQTEIIKSIDPSIFIRKSNIRDEYVYLYNRIKKVYTYISELISELISNHNFQSSKWIELNKYYNYIQFNISKNIVKFSLIFYKICKKDNNIPLFPKYPTKMKFLNPKFTSEFTYEENNNDSINIINRRDRDIQLFEHKQFILPNKLEEIYGDLNEDSDELKDESKDGSIDGESDPSKSPSNLSFNSSIESSYDSSINLPDSPSRSSIDSSFNSPDSSPKSLSKSSSFNPPSSPSRSSSRSLPKSPPNLSGPSLKIAQQDRMLYEGMQDLDYAEVMAIRTSNELDRQNERIRKISKNVGDINDELTKANKHVKNIENPLRKLFEKFWRENT